MHCIVPNELEIVLSNFMGGDGVNGASSVGFSGSGKGGQGRLNEAELVILDFVNKKTDPSLLMASSKDWTD